MTGYLVRAKLEFDGDFEKVGKSERLRQPHNLPINIGPFQLDQSPNFEFYLNEVVQIELDGIRQGNPDPRYPVSLFYVETRLEESTKSRPHLQADHTFEHLEWLLRLFQPGGISVRRHEHIFRVQEKKWDPLVYFIGHSPQPVPVPLYERPPYPLDDATVDSFVEFFDKFWDELQENLPSYLTIALSRFNSSYEKRSLVDRLIDLVIALEALFGDSSFSKANIIAKRCSSWLNQPGKEHQGTSALIKKMYKTRNNVVHGEEGIDLSEKHDFETRLNELEDVVRASLVKFWTALLHKVRCPTGKRLIT